MLAYNLETKTVCELDKLHPKDKLFISLSSTELSEILSLLGARDSLYDRISASKEKVMFSSFYEHDYLSYMYYVETDGEIAFEKFSIVLGSSYLLFVYEDRGTLHSEYIENFIADYLDSESSSISLSHAYYSLLNSSFTDMFDALDDYESRLSNIENHLMDESLNLNLKEFSHMKKVSLKIKKFNRQLLYLGDQIILNSNEFVDSENMIYFQNIDTKINILYDYSADIHEFTEHLQDIYDSKTTDKTNSLLTKLTLFTALATPVTVISGLYGMNFVHMPALKNPYGYYIALAIMLISILLIFLFLRKNKLL